MEKINLKRVVMGGLLAGLIIQTKDIILAVVLAEDWELALSGFELSEPGLGLIIWFFLIGFILGIVGVAIYAGYRPRCGAGPKTALWAGLTVWFLTNFMGGSGLFFFGLFPMKIFWWQEILSLVVVPLAVIAGAWLYKE